MPYVEKDVSRNDDAARELMSMGERGVPVILVDGQKVVGFNRPLLEQLLAHSSGAQPDDRPRLGAAIADAAQHAPAGNPPGAYVGRVRPGSAAERAGLRAGDIIIRLAGQPVRNAADVERTMAGVRAQSRLPVQVVRQDRTLDLELAF